MTRGNSRRRPTGVLPVSPLALSCTMAVALMLTASWTDVRAQPSPSRRKAEELVRNVVAVRTANSQGFGFIVGIRDNSLLIATALHTVEAEDTGRVEVCFGPNAEPCDSAEVAYVADAIGALPAIDLAILATPYPDHLPWRVDAVAPQAPAGAEVRSIGRAGTWYVPPVAGRLVATTADAATVEYTGLDVTTGVSGAPIVTANGIVGMHTLGMGASGARGIAIQEIRERLERFAPGAWVLRSSPACPNRDLTGSELRGREVVIRFRSASLQTAVEAAQVLHCAGASPRLQPHRSDVPWPGAAVRYGAGEIVVARAVQNALEEFGRFPAVLGKAGDTIEVRLP